jgi:hypothetical protein
MTIKNLRVLSTFLIKRKRRLKLIYINEMTLNFMLKISVNDYFANFYFRLSKALRNWKILVNSFQNDYAIIMIIMKRL